MAKFEPGQSGNPAGRPAGARAKLGEAFVSELLADFLKHGRDAIERVRQEKPDQYLKVIASLLPKDVNLSTAPSDEDLTDEELLARFGQLVSSVGRLLH